MTSLSHGRPKRVKLDVVQMSRLLDIPGELRNKMYSYCVEEAANNVEPSAVSGDIYLQPFDTRPLGGNTRYEFDPTNPARRSRQFFSLTQVCRLLREEFRPLYMANLDIHIWFPHMNAFLETFVITWDCFHKDAKPIITVHVPRMREWVDLTLAMKLCSAAPGLDLRFQSTLHGSAPSEGLTHVFEKCRATLTSTASAATPQPILMSDEDHPTPPILWGDERRPVPILQGVIVWFPDHHHNRYGSVFLTTSVRLLFSKEDEREWIGGRRLRRTGVALVENWDRVTVEQEEIDQVLVGLDLVHPRRWIVTAEVENQADAVVKKGHEGIVHELDWTRIL